MTESKHVLTQIQAELKAPKGQYNSFGKYKYRSAEDILEAVKPKLAKYNAKLVLTDEPVMVGDRIYIKATCEYEDTDGQLTVTGYAREANIKKGMDDSQITGTASSYARKYALNGLFLIDDTKDADTDAFQKQTRQPATKQPARKTAPAKKAPQPAMTDQQLLDYKINYANRDVSLPALVKKMAEGGKGSQEARTVLHGLKGRDRVAAGEIYNRQLYLTE